MSTLRSSRKHGISSEPCTAPIVSQHLSITCWMARRCNYRFEDGGHFYALEVVLGLLMCGGLHLVVADLLELTVRFVICLHCCKGVRAEVLRLSTSRTTTNSTGALPTAPGFLFFLFQRCRKTILVTFVACGGIRQPITPSRLAQES